MSLIGVRELRQQASEVIRRVREQGAEFVVTYQGRPVAIILPLDTERAEAEMVQAGKKAVPATITASQPVEQEIREALPAYQIAQRPTVQELEERITLAAQGIAQQYDLTLGQILSSLAERAQSQQANFETRNGVPLFPIQADAGTATLDLVNQLRDEMP
jgi:prevent-host-death family protein